MKLLALSGFIPEQICDTVRFSQYSGERNISHYCGYASDFICQVLNDDRIDGAVYPKTCDSSRIITSYLEESKKFHYQLNVPARQDEDAICYFASELKRYKQAIETYYQIEISDIEDRTEKINKRNLDWKRLYNALENVDYYAYLSMIHNNLKEPLSRQKTEEKYIKENTSDKRVYLVGSYLSNLDIVQIIEQQGLKIVGDNLPESGRLVSSAEINIGENIYYSIAAGLLRRRLSPTQNNFNRILQSDVEEIKRKRVDGVIMVIQKYCEPYEFLYSVYKKALDKEGIPLLKLVVLNSEDAGKVKLQLEAFSDII